MMNYYSKINKFTKKKENKMEINYKDIVKKVNKLKID